MKTRICKKCEQEKELNEDNFYKNRRGSFEKICKHCRNELKANQDREKREKYYAKDGYKICKCCDIKKDVSEFGLYSKSKDGYLSKCLECSDKKDTWTQADKDIIIANYNNLIIKDIIPLLSVKRTEKSVLHMSKKLGLYKISNVVENYDLIKYKYIEGKKYKLCKCCNEYLPLEFLYFPKDDTCKDGFRNICKKCKGENYALSTAYIWNDEEVEIIKNNYTDMTNNEIKDKYFPHLTIEQIMDKAHNMNLHKSEETKLKAIRDSQTDEWKNKISEIRIKNGKSKGENNPMYGSARFGSLNPNYKGGISNLENELRRNINQWKLDSMKECNFKCIFTGEKFDHIHHLYSFDNIVKDTLEELKFPIYENISRYTDIEIKQIINKCIEIHYRYPFGKCMKEEYHKLFHKYYGYGSNTPNQFDEFMIRFFNGEFDIEVEKQYSSNYILNKLEVINE